MSESRIEEVIRDVVYSAPGRVRDIQSALIPAIYTGSLEIVDRYTLDEVIYKDPKSTFISTPAIFKDYYKDKYKRTFSLSLQEAIRLGYSQPFLLFIDNVFIKWSLINIIHDYNKDYIIINGVYHGEVKIIYLNNSISYSESGLTEKMLSETIMFSFNDDGLFSYENASVIITTPNKKLKTENIYKLSGGTTVSKLNIDYKHRVFSENFFAFNVEGKLSQPEILTFPFGVYKVTTDEPFLDIVVFYREDLVYKTANSLLPVNTSYLRDMIESYNNGESVKPYLEQLIQDIEFKLDPKENWTNNRADMLKRIFEYNPLLMKDAYDSNIRYELYTGAEMKEMIGGETGMYYGTIKVINNRLMSQVLIFINGLCATNYIKHYLNKFEYQFMNLKDEDVIEFMYFENINNNAYTVTFNKDDSFLNSDEITLDELAIFSSELENPEFPDMEYSKYTTFPVDFTIGENNEIVLPEFYYGKQVTVTSKNRYAYRFIDIKEDTVSFELGPDFAYCSDIKRYIVFINGMKLNSDEYFITCMKNTRPFSKVLFYSRYLLTPGDRVAVYYLPAILDGLFNSDMVSETEIEAIFNSDTIYYDMPYEGFLNDGNSVQFLTVDGEQANVTINNDGTITLNDWVEETTIIIKETYLRTPGISENGYYYVNKDKIPYPLSRDLFFVFNNGKKIPYDHLKDIGTDVMAVTENTSVGKVFLSAYHIPIPELENLMKQYSSVLDSVIRLCDEDELNKLFNIFTTISYTEDITDPNYDRAALINEVIRDNWMSPGVNYGVPITYDYYSDMFGYEDSEGNIIFPTMDATQENSIIFTE